MDYWAPKTALSSMRNFLITSVLCLAFACAEPQKSSIPYYNSPDFTPYFISETEAATQISHRIKPFAFYNQDSILFDSKSLEGKVYVANFFFTQCNNICPDMTAQLKRIEEEALEKIFIPFFTTKQKGSGIGLSLSKQIMRRHKGNIQVRSELGQGTTVKLIFNG